MSRTRCLQSRIDVWDAPFFAGFSRLPLGSQEEGSLDADTCVCLGIHTLWSGKTPVHFMSSFLLCYQHRHNSLKPRDLLAPDSKKKDPGHRRRTVPKALRVDLWRIPAGFQWDGLDLMSAHCLSGPGRGRSRDLDNVTERRPRGAGATISSCPR